MSESSAAREADRHQRGPGRPPIPVERIVATALEIVDADGADALTLRALANRMGSSTATLYRHFAGRTELTRAVVEALFGQLDLDDDIMADEPWDTALRHLAEQMFHVLRRHRNVAPLLLAELPAGPMSLVIRERGLSMLMAHGFGPRQAVQVYATLARFVLGFGVQLASEPADVGGDDPALEHALPATHRAMLIGSIELVEEFRFGLDMMIDGLRQWHASAAGQET